MDGCDLGVVAERGVCRAHGLFDDWSDIGVVCALSMSVVSVVRWLYTGTALSSAGSSPFAL